MRAFLIVNVDVRRGKWKLKGLRMNIESLCFQTASKPDFWNTQKRYETKKSAGMPVIW